MMRSKVVEKLIFKFNRKKAVATLLYISRILRRDLGSMGADFHKIFKILYFADQKHIVRYGRPIIGDFYIAMYDGPVPSKMYDMLKIVRGDSFIPNDFGLLEYFEVFDSYYLKPKKKADMDEFSESDIECIDESLKENKKKSFNLLRKISHDSAYQKAEKNVDAVISYEDIAKVGGANKATLEFIRIQSENSRVFKV